MPTQPFHVLIVEDDPPIASLERRILEDAGFQVEEVRRGDRALESLDRSDIAVMLLDYRLPDMTGAEVVAALGDRVRSVPVVMISGYAQPEIMDEMLGSGIAEYLVKDTDLSFLERLPTVVRDLVDRPGT